MKSRFTLPSNAFILAILLLGTYAITAYAQTGQKRNAHSASPENFTVAGNSPPPVIGSGVVGQIARWTTSSKANPAITDSIITQTDAGNIGIGTTTPASKFTVQGMIETTLGGYKFPDGTVQTTAATSGLGSVSRDSTLTGNGTAANPLGIALPLNLSASSAFPFPLVTITNTSSSASGGPGVKIQAGDGTSGGGGTGLDIIAGDSASGSGGIALKLQAGISNSGNGGIGAVVHGGDSTNSNGGDGLLVGAGNGSGAGKVGGTGVIVFGGAGANGAADGRAGQFMGDVEVTGMLSKGGGSFKIDHPLDPANKYLFHSFVESPDMMNIYNGNVVTDGNGEAVVDMPSYFEALNREFRYQLTVIGAFAQAIIADEIKGNSFLIRTSAPNVKVSWQVTGVRQDAWANKNRIRVEVEKDERERGRYIHPEAFNQPEESGIAWTRQPEKMKQMKDTRGRARQNQQ